MPIVLAFSLSFSLLLMGVSVHYDDLDKLSVLAGEQSNASCHLSWESSLSANNPFKIINSLHNKREGHVRVNWQSDDGKTELYDGFLRHTSKPEIIISTTSSEDKPEKQEGTIKFCLTEIKSKAPFYTLGIIEKQDKDQKPIDTPKSVSTLIDISFQLDNSFHTINMSVSSEVNKTTTRYLIIMTTNNKINQKLRFKWSAASSPILLTTLKQKHDAELMQVDDNGKADYLIEGAFRRQLTSGTISVEDTKGNKLCTAYAPAYRIIP